MEFDEEPATVTGGDKPSLFAQTKLETTSFALSPERLIAQAVTPEQFSIRLHAPEVRNVCFVEHDVVGIYPTVTRRSRGR